jgi:hypothetical protein
MLRSVNEQCQFSFLGDPYPMRRVLVRRLDLETPKRGVKGVRGVLAVPEGA